MRKHWPRWIFASVSKYFFDTLTAQSVNVFVEGTDRDADALGDDHAEFRMDGPRIRELQANEHHIWIAVNMLFKANMNDGNFHRKHVLAGQIADAFISHIPLYKYGNGVDDDDSQFGCLTLLDRPTGIQINHFGQIEQTVRVEQGTVEGHYTGYLTDTT